MTGYDKFKRKRRKKKGERMRLRMGGEFCNEKRGGKGDCYLEK